MLETLVDTTKRPNILIHITQFSFKSVFNNSGLFNSGMNQNHGKKKTDIGSEGGRRWGSHAGAGSKAHPCEMHHHRSWPRRKATRNYLPSPKSCL